MIVIDSGGGCCGCIFLAFDCSGFVAFDRYGFFFFGWVLIELLARFDCGGGALVLIVGVERGRNGEEKRVK